MKQKQLAYIPNADIGDIVDIWSYLYIESTSINWQCTSNKNCIRTAVESYRPTAAVIIFLISENYGAWCFSPVILIY